MDRGFLQGLAGLNSSTSAGLARAVLVGDDAALGPLHDVLCDEGFTRMQSLKVGQSYLVQTVTHYYTGRLTAVSFSELVLEDAAWIPSTGRFHEALRTGTLEEVEPFLDPVTVNMGSVVAVTPWRHPLPREAV